MGCATAGAGEQGGGGAGGAGEGLGQGLIGVTHSSLLLVLSAALKAAFGFLLDLYNFLTYPSRGQCLN